MRRTLISIAAFASLLAAACDSEEPEPTNGSPLELDEQPDDALVGTMQLEDLVVEFSARELRPQVFGLEVRYADVTFTGEYDYNENLFLLDGFVTSTGADIIISDDDLLVMEELGRVLSEEGLAKTHRPDVEHQRGVVQQTPGSAMTRMLAVWSTRGVDESPTVDIKATHGRTIEYLCGYLTGFGIQATHDCWDCWNDWDGWSYVNIGPQGANDCYPDSCNANCSNANTYSCGRLSCEQSGGGPNGTWQWGSNSDKYGACTVWDTNAYTRDCLWHDHCVRNDHTTGSSWCSDDALPAADDQSSANDCIMNDGCSNSCGGYSTAGGCWCDSTCDSYGDCCMDKHQKCG